MHVRCLLLHILLVHVTRMNEVRFVLADFRAHVVDIVIMAQPRCFQVGDNFSSYDEFKKRLEEFEKINFVQLAHKGALYEM